MYIEKREQKENVTEKNTIGKNAAERAAKNKRIERRRMKRGGHEISSHIRFTYRKAGKRVFHAGGSAACAEADPEHSGEGAGGGCSHCGGHL